MQSFPSKRGIMTSKSVANIIKSELREMNINPQTPSRKLYEKKGSIYLVLSYVFPSELVVNVDKVVGAFGNGVN